MIEVVYYPVSDGLVLLTRDAALERATLWKALNTARTWEEFRSMLSEQRYEEAVERVNENYEQPKKENWLHPAPNAVFDTRQIDGHPDGDWPEWPAQEMLDWIPEEI